MKKIFKLTLATLIVASIAGCGITMFKEYEEPDYTLINTYQAEPLIEQRRYGARLVAEVEAQGQRDEAIGDGFRLLADYIFGNNTARASIEMTTPVAQQPTNETIEMTSPMAQQSLGANAWQVRFYMPKHYTSETLPMPNDPQVNIRNLEPYEAIVLQFSGRTTEENIAKHQQLLETFITQENIQTTGQVSYAFYDPPWTPWFMKRNEIIYTLSAQ